MEIIRRYKKSILKLIRDLGILVAILITYEVWQTKSKDKLPESIISKQVMTLSGKKKPLLEETKSTLIYVFAPWCSVCKLSSSQLERPSEEQNWNIIALASSYNDVDELVAFQKDNDLKLEVFLSSQKIDQMLNITAYPSYIIINEKGEIAHFWTGFTTEFGALLRLYFFTEIL